MAGTTTAVTGRLGKHVVGSSYVKRITQWVVNPTLATKSEWGDSETNGYTARAAGRKDATFTTEGKFDSTDEQYDLFMPEDKLKSVLWMNATLYWHFPCSMCDDFSLTVNVDTEEVIGWTSSWGADGIYYYPGEAGAPSETLP